MKNLSIRVKRVYEYRPILDIESILVRLRGIYKKELGVEVDVINRGRGRCKDAIYKQATIYTLKNLGFTNLEIGNVLGDIKHCTVIHNYKQFQSFIEVGDEEACRINTTILSYIKK